MIFTTHLALNIMIGTTISSGVILNQNSLREFVALVALIVIVLCIKFTNRESIDQSIDQ